MLCDVGGGEGECLEGAGVNSVVRRRIHGKNVVKREEGGVVHQTKDHRGSQDGMERRDEGVSARV